VVTCRPPRMTVGALLESSASGLTLISLRASNKMAVSGGTEAPYSPSSMLGGS
jgi:hypothetical protein